MYSVTRGTSAHSEINFTTDCFGAVICEKPVHIVGTYVFSDEQRENRVKWCKKMLKNFKSVFAAEVNFIATGDETWLYYYDVLTESQCKVWVFENEEVPVQVRKS